MTNMDSLKESLRLASTNSFKLEDVDMSQFQGEFEFFLELSILSGWKIKKTKTSYFIQFQSTVP